MALTATLGEMDGVETALRIERGEVSLDEVVRAAITRAEEAAGLGAITTRCFDRARTHAPSAGPFRGVPTFVKDLSRLAGVATTWGSRGARDCVAKRSDPFVRRFEGTGVVALGKSATPELGLTGTTEPLGWDACRNPWDPARSAGGSSGGAAALVAAGVVPFAHASDGGGSIRIPSACCGLVGLKPSRGLFDIDGSNLLPLNIATNGIVSRTVRDQEVFFEALAPQVMRGFAMPARALRVAVFADAAVGTPVHPETRGAVVDAGKLCESLGHQVEEIRCPFEASVLDDFLVYWGFVAWIQIKSARMVLDRRFDAEQLEPWTRGLAGTFASEPARALGAIVRLRSFARTYAELTKRYDVLVTPTTAEPAPLLGHLAPDQPFSQKFDRVRAYCAFTPLQNAVGAPAISLPLGRASSGLPIGVQFAAARGGDPLLLGLAKALEMAAPWPRIAPRECWQSVARG